MVTRAHSRSAGILALITAALLTASLVLFQGGPPTSNPPGLLNWFAAESTSIQAAAILWLLAMLALVAFAVGFREAMWATMFDRSWITVLFIQGAAVFATVAVVATAVGWALATQAAAGTIDVELASAVWAVARTLLLFATWGLVAPLLVVSMALWRHSTLGRVGALAAVLVAGALLVPITWAGGLFAFAAWMAFVGATLLVPGSAHVSAPAQASSEIS